MSTSWGTDLLADINMFGFMVVVRLPDGMLPADTSVCTAHKEKLHFSDTHAAKVQDILHYDFRVEVQRFPSWLRDCSRVESHSCKHNQPPVTQLI